MLVNIISSKFPTGAQLPLATVQRKVALVPDAIPVIVVVAEVEFVIVAIPANTVHVPVPITGDVAFITNVLVLHCVMLARPASAVLGDA